MFARKHGDNMNIQFPIDRLTLADNPYQPRMNYDPEHIEKLAEDIRLNGLINPPQVRAVLDGKPIPAVVAAGNVETESYLWEVVTGHNRYRAYKVLFEHDERYCLMPAVVVTATNEMMAQLAWSENAHRRDLTAIERAKAMQRVIDDFGWTQERVAQQFGVSRPVVANALRLLRLPAEIRQHIEAGQMSERQAMAFFPLVDMNPNGKLFLILMSFVRMAIVDELSSDAIRHRINQEVQYHTHDLERAKFPADALPNLGLPNCNACSFSIKFNGKQRCSSEECFTEKKSTWIRTRLAQARAATGFQIVEYGNEKWSHRVFYGVGSKFLEQAITTKCQNLCVAYSEHPSEPRPDGFEDVFIGCVKQGRCKCASSPPDQSRLPAPVSREAKKRLRVGIDSNLISLHDLTDSFEIEGIMDRFLARCDRKRFNEQAARWGWSDLILEVSDERTNHNQ